MVLNSSLSAVNQWHFTTHFSRVVAYWTYTHGVIGSNLGEFNFKQDFTLVPNGITSIPHLIQIRPAVLEINHANRQT